MTGPDHPETGPARATDSSGEAGNAEPSTATGLRSRFDDDCAVLAERPIDVSYGYLMRCEDGCGLTTHVSPITYVASADALVPCDHCDEQVHFGPYAAALRVDDDLALSNGRVASLAW